MTSATESGAPDYQPATLPEPRNAVEEAIVSRHSIRAFKPDPVAPDLVRHILEIASRSPSGTNTQPWHVHVCTGSNRDALVAEQHAALMNGQTPDAPEYDLLVGPDSPYGGRVTHPDGFVDAWTHVGGDPKGGHTSDVKEEPARLDYCFVSASLRHRISSCQVDTEAPGSDHQPLWLELSD